MAALKFASSHNKVAFLDKPTESDVFEQIVKTINGEVQIQALVDKRKVIITETSVRSYLQLEDAEVLRLLTNQALEIDSLKRRVKKLEKKKGSRTHRLGRLYKVGRSARVVSSKDKGLGAQEDAFKQGRKIDEIDQDAEVTLVDETQERYGDNLIFDTGVLDNEQDMAKKEVDMAEKDVSTADPVTTAGEVVTTTTTTVDELILAQTLIEIKVAKPKAVTTAVTRPKARGVIVQELNAELEEEEKLARQREEDANIAEWDNVQAMMDADYELAARLQAEEQGELSIEEKSRLFVELMDKRKNHFARLKVEEQRRKPPTKAQNRNTMFKAEVDDDQEEAEMKKYMEIVPDDEVKIDAIPLATKPPIIVD
ncbi:hypothetical protein Tco_0477386 [Tanacetum coccineum]